ncbi:MAG: hypothetical protein KDH88_13150 [Chromatiales bacterium]|nr:hypothetical protein [Chromatiales bacterium]
MKSQNMLNHLRYGLLGACCALSAHNAGADDLNLSTLPLFLVSSGEIVPNVVMSLAYEQILFNNLGNVTTHRDFRQFEIITKKPAVNKIAHNSAHTTGTQIQDVVLVLPPLAKSDLERTTVQVGNQNLPAYEIYRGIPGAEDEDGVESTTKSCQQYYDDDPFPDVCYPISATTSNPRSIEHLFHLSFTDVYDRSKIALLDANPQYFSADLNLLAYDPGRTGETRYLPWLDASDLGITDDPTTADVNEAFEFPEADPTNLKNNPIQRLGDTFISVHTVQPKNMAALFGYDVAGNPYPNPGQSAIAILKRYNRHIRLLYWTGWIDLATDADLALGGFRRDGDNIELININNGGNANNGNGNGNNASGALSLTTALSDEELDEMAYYTYTVLDEAVATDGTDAAVRPRAFYPKMIETGELQNFANWFQYHRRLQFVMKDVVSRALAAAPNYRFGLFSGTAKVEGVPTETDAPEGFANLDAYLEKKKKDLIAKILTTDLSYLPGTTNEGGLIATQGDVYRTINAVGEYYDTTGDDAPIRESCQPNFSVVTSLVTDYQRTAVSTGDAYLGLNSAFPAVTQNKRDGDILPFVSAADLGYYYYHHKDYYANRPSLPRGRVLINEFDTNSNLHVNLAAISLGGESELKALDTDSDGFPNPTNNVVFDEGAAWESPTDGNDRAFSNADDLWHAAYNARGAYADALNYQDAIAGLTNALGKIASRAASAVSVAQASTTLQSNSLVYQARFNSGDRAGQLRAICIDSDGNLQTYENSQCATPGNDGVIEPVWEAGCSISGQTLDVDTNLCEGTRSTTAHSDRKIISFKPASNGGAGIAFAGANLSAEQVKAVENGATAAETDAGSVLSRRMDYLRGSAGTAPLGEADAIGLGASGGVFRHRTSLMGDVVNSRPLLVGPPARIYPDSFVPSDGSTTYASFKTTAPQNARPPMVYVGANDGMMHAFNAAFTPPSASAPGKEAFAYVPSEVYANLSKVMDRDQYDPYPFVDGTLAEGDIWDASGNWKTILVGALRRGGQGIYALDITNPAGINESTAADAVLWEFTDDPNRGNYGDKDLGYTYGNPKIVLLRGATDGYSSATWGVLVSNGYNNTVDDADHQFKTFDDPDQGIEGDGDTNCLDGSSDTRCSSASDTGNAVLYILDANSGQLLAKMDTLAGGNVAGVGTGTPNGLSSPFPVDVDGDFVTDYVYAGDLKGNLWRFDLTSGSPASWGNSVDGDGNPTTNTRITRIFNGGEDYPITAEPVVGRPPYLPTGPQSASGNGVMVYFGTGKYLEPADNKAGTVEVNNEDVNKVDTFYALWDRMLTTGQAVFTRHDATLAEQCVIGENLILAGTDADGQDGTTVAARAISDFQFTYKLPDVANDTGKLGWYMDLIAKSATATACGAVQNSANEGERLINAPILRDQRLFFTSTIPSDLVCDQGGNSWLMVLQARTGGRLPFGVFDLSDDGSGVFDQQDKVTVGADNLFASGAAIEGIASPPVVSQTGGRNDDVVTITTTGVGPRLVSGGGGGGEDGGDEDGDRVVDNSLQTQRQNDGRDPTTLESWRVLQ